MNEFNEFSNMSIDNNKAQKVKITKTHRILAKNSLYSFLSSYGSFFLSLVTSFLLARLITQELWGMLIIALSYIAIFNIFLSFLPPGLDATLNYYIPQYLALKEYSNLKFFIKKAIYLKLLFTCPLFLISLVLFFFFSQIFTITIKDYTNLLIILSPLIVILSLNNVLASIYRGLNMFNVLFLLLLIRYCFNISALIFSFYFFNPLKIEIVAYIDLLSFLFPFILSCLIVIIKYTKIQHTEKRNEDLKDFISKTLNYGGPIRLGRFFTDIWSEIQTQSIAIFASAEIVTGFNISKNYIGVSSSVALTFSNPLLISFSGLSAKNNYYQINKLYNLVLIYSIFLLTLITGVLFLCTEFFLAFIYGQSYLIYTNILNLMLFTLIFLSIGMPFEALILSIGKTKVMLSYRVIAFIVRVPIFLTFLINFGLLWGIFGIIMSNLIISIIAVVLSIKVGKIELNVIKLILLFLTFFIALGVVWLLEIVILNKVNLLILESLNLLFFSKLNLISISLFILTFLCLIIIFRVFTTKDIEYIEAFFDKSTGLHIFIRKCMNILKKIVRD